MARVVWIYESEVRSIAQEAFSWRVETGGDLFGFWEPEPVVMLATRAGGNVERMLAAHCFDLNYLSALSIQLHVDWGLFYFGDWHTHPPNRFLYSLPQDHHLPSTVDQNRIRQIARRNQFPRMIEFISTPTWLENGSPEFIRLYPYLYEGTSSEGPDEMEIRVFPEISPVREALLTLGALPEQRLAEFDLVQTSCVSCLQQTISPDVELEISLREIIRARLRQRASSCDSTRLRPKT